MDFLKREKYEIDFIGAIMEEVRQEQRKKKNEEPRVPAMSIAKNIERFVSLVILYFFRNSA